MENPIDNLQRRGAVKPVRKDLADYRSLLQRKDQAVITDDAP